MAAMRSKIRGMFSPEDKPSAAERGNGDAGECEIRPGGMLVQKRNPESNQNPPPPLPTIKITVKHGSSRHEIRISPQASFGELKKMVAERTGMNPDDQKLIYKKRERNSKSFLDVERVKDGSKLVLVEDATSRERRCLEMIKNANLERATRSLNHISLQVDKFAQQVLELEATASRERRVAEMEVENLTGRLMSELVRLDELVVEGDLKLQKRMQEKRVQSYIETLDKLKLQTSAPTSKMSLQPKGRVVSGQKLSTKQKQKQEKREEKKQPTLRQSHSFVLSTKWETFD